VFTRRRLLPDRREITPIIPLRRHLSTRRAPQRRIRALSRSRRAELYEGLDQSVERRTLPRARGQVPITQRCISLLGLEENNKNLRLEP
jgi:hypothetical protein